MTPHTRGALDEATRKLFTTQAKLYRTYRGLLSGRGTAEDSRPLRLQEVQLLSQHEQALRGAQTDCYEVWGCAVSGGGSITCPRP